MKNVSLKRTALTGLCIVCLLAPGKIEGIETHILIEEFSGTWCGYCPRGIEGLRQISEIYGDRVIPVVLHGKDEFAVEACKKFIEYNCPGYPSALVMRGKSPVNPVFDILNPLCAKIPETSPYGLEVTARKEEDIAVKWSVKLLSSEDTFDAGDFKVVFYIVEDGVPARQANGYSGSAEPMFGWEGLPKNVSCALDHVVVGSYPNPYGIKLTSLSEDPQKERWGYETELPGGFGGTEMYGVAVLLDASTGAVLNAAEVELENDVRSCSPAVVMVENEHAVYDLTGRLLTTVPASGLYIQDRKLKKGRGDGGSR